MISRALRGLARRTAFIAPRQRPRAGPSLLIGVACAAAGVALRLAMLPLVPAGVPFATFFPFILVASFWGGTIAGLVTMALAGLAADLLWLPAADASNVPSRLLTLIAYGIIGFLTILFASAFRALVDAHREAEERAILLAHEMRHRTGNLLGIVQAISSQTARTAATAGEHHALFSNRIAALARAQDLISRSPEGPIALRELILRAIEPFEAERFALSGPDVALQPHLASSCALLFHELGTNATKYGALSRPDGAVRIDWSPDGARIRVEWRESGGPEVAPPARKGFGSRLIHTAFPPEFGDVAIDYQRDGVCCAISFVPA